VKQVTIIGKGAGWQDAPMVGETWGITQLILRRPVSMVIDMNVYDDGRWGDEQAREADAARQYCLDHAIPYIDLATYPIDDIIGHFGTDYFTNTVDYALALAIYRGYRAIDMYGVNMATFGEYAYQKPGVEFWTGMAMGRGIKVNVHGSLSVILKSRDGLLYGYDRRQLWAEKMAQEMKRLAAAG
jgi:hypothetical protein